MSEHVDLDKVLDLPLDEGNDLNSETIREALWRLLDTLWNEGEGFSGKHPLGNSGWDLDLLIPLVKAGLIEGTLDEDGYLDDLPIKEQVKGETLIFKCIRHVFYD